MGGESVFQLDLGVGRDGQRPLHDDSTERIAFGATPLACGTRAACMAFSLNTFDSLADEKSMSCLLAWATGG